jgi:hypothetical protein
LDGWESQEKIERKRQEEELKMKRLKDLRELQQKALRKSIREYQAIRIT